MARLVLFAAAARVVAAAAPVPCAAGDDCELADAALLQLGALPRNSRVDSKAPGAAVSAASTLLAAPAGSGGALPGGIPRILHQEWKPGPLPADMAAWRETWRKCLGDGWELKLWTDEENRELVKEHFPEFLETFDSYDEDIKRFDSVRYVYMHVYGGVYADLDLECVGDPLATLENRSLLLSYAAPYCFMQSAFFASRPGHGFWRQALTKLPLAKERRVMEATGPVFLSNMFEEYTGQQGAAYHISSLDTFMPTAGQDGEVAVIGNEHICWDYTSINFGTCDRDYPAAFARNHKMQTWKNEGHKFARRGQPKMGEMRCGNDKRTWENSWIEKRDRCDIWKCPGIATSAAAKPQAIGAQAGA